MENKTYFLSIADLYFNLLITLKEDGINPKILTYKEINDYGKKLVELGRTKNLEVILSLCRDKTWSFINHYSYMLEDCNTGIKLIQDVKIEELINDNRGYLPLDILLLILDKNFKKEVIDGFRKEHRIDDRPFTRLFIRTDEKQY